MKKVLVGLGVAIVLIVIAVVLLPFLIDLNAYKDRYQPLIEDALNRKIVLNDLRLTIVPRLGVRIVGFTVMDDPAFGRAPFASLESLDIGIKLMPLLSRRVEVEEITLKHPVISVTKNPQGLLNVSTLGRPGAPAPEAPKEAPPVPEGGPLRALALLAVDRVALEHGTLTYRDESASKHTEYTMQDVNVLLQSVRLGDMARLHVDTVVHPYNMPFKLDGVVGPLTDTLEFKMIDLALALGTITATVTGSAVAGHAKMIIASPIINTGHLPIALPLTKPVEIRDLHVEAEADYPVKPNTPPLEAATVKILRFAVGLGNSTIAVNGHLLEGEGRLMAVSPAINTADLPVILPLRKAVEVKDVKLSAGMKGQQAHIDSLTLNLFGGRLLSQAGVTLGSPSPSPFEGHVALHGVQLGPVVEALIDKVLVSGTADVQLALQGRGFSRPELMSALEGTGSFAVKDGKIEGVNLLEEAVALLKAVGVRLDTAKATVFSAIEGNFRVARGEINVDRFLMESHDFQATGAGTIGLDQRLNLKTKLNLSEALSRQLVGSTPALRVAMAGGRIAVPLTITGTAQAPVYGLDTKAFAGKVQEQVKEQVKEVVDDLMKGKKPDLDKGKEALKRLFGR